MEHWIGTNDSDWREKEVRTRRYPISLSKPCFPETCGTKTSCWQILNLTFFFSQRSRAPIVCDNNKRVMRLLPIDVGLTEVPLLFRSSSSSNSSRKLSSWYSKPSAVSLPRASPVGRRTNKNPMASRDLLPWRCVCFASHWASACARQPPVHSHFPSNECVTPLKPRPPGDTWPVLLTPSAKERAPH